MGYILDGLCLPGLEVIGMVGRPDFPDLLSSYGFAILRFL